MASAEDVEGGNKSNKQEMQQPLLQPKETVINVENSGGSGGGHPWMVYLSTAVAVCGSYEFGTCVGYSSPTQSALTAERGLSTAEYSLFGSILTFGAMIGAITSGPIADLIGRKGAMRVYAAFCVVGWLSIYFAKNPLALDIGRLARGYGMGAFSYVVPVYIAEIAPVNLRGALTTLNQVMICMGVSVGFVIGMVLSWRALALAGMIPCAILLLGLFLIPESPRWLAKQQAQKEFEVALQKLRGKDANIIKEAAEIQNYIEELDKLPKVNLIDLFQRSHLRFVTIGVGLMIFQQFGGINGICFYESNIFETAGFPPTIGTIIYAFLQVLEVNSIFTSTHLLLCALMESLILQVVITAIRATLIDKTGRKPLLLVSAAGLVFGCVLTAIAFYLKDHHIDKAAAFFAVAGILVYISSFSAGMGAIPWVIMSEIFPINVKGLAGSLATLVNWFGAWAISYTFNFLMQWSSCGTFILYATINALAIIFVIKVVPERRGRTLEQIQAAIGA